ncbi:multidrug DMT transporter permease [Nitrosopumilus sp. b1]|uniref:DMT family transporter n=1 Tax=Nitrosopumilus sp. b1 TaxID=2109907 RepID=UPI0015F57558|nr:DMT family transporter [Nitrosopumilus sp. b1]KAF6242567.1 multidrug DMT transporter permease [Nitrosopumilus sp. b1]
MNIEKKSVFKKISKVNLKSTTTLGITLAVLAAAFSALPNVIPKPLMEGNSDGITPNPLMLVFVIYVINGLFFTPLAGKQSPINKLSKYTIFLLILLGVLETSGTLAYTVGLQDTSALNASVLVNGETVFAILIGITLFKEKLGKREVLPFMLIVSGTVFLPLGSDLYHQNWELSEFVYGDMLILLSGFFYCLDTFIAKKISNSINTRRVVQIMSCSGAVFTLALMLYFEIPFDIAVEQFSIISMVGFLGIGVTMMFFVIALRLIGAVRTVLLYSTSTIFSVIYSTVYLSEAITIINITSVGIVMIGIFALRQKLGSE